ncbi:NADPH-dependent F420 reductase [Dyella psychrodurans]|uniref:NADP oxidoreductase n=1 Tax=Dyella psychrodurans TaxID=1927960 RepID=A0A370XCF7_9GAMM|nr:NAD(P)-binding domain-containing protein [Dyella psychrodurans]RDS86079.1 NADP oxidoreductase [Dyella psychrodurans]
MNTPASPSRSNHSVPADGARSIGIIGAGQIGSAFARALARRGIPAVIANSRGPASLHALTTELGPSIRAVPSEEAAKADIVLVAVNWSKLSDALGGLDLRGRIVIDANNPIEPPTFQPADLKGRTSSEVFADLVPGARVVKAFNHLPAQWLSNDPHAEGGQRVLFFAGDDTQAKREVASLIESLGFFGVDLGPLVAGGRLTEIPGGALPIHNLVKFA